MQPGQSIGCEGAQELNGVGEVLELVVVMVGPDWLCETCHPHLHAAGLPTTLAGQRALNCKCKSPKVTEHCVLCNYMLQHKPQLGHGATMNNVQCDGVSRTIPTGLPALEQGLYCFPAAAC